MHTLERRKKEISKCSGILCQILAVCSEFEELLIVNPRIGVFVRDYGSILSSLDVDLDFGIGIRDHPALNCLIDKYVRDSGSCVIYTDGGKSGDSNYVGFAVFL